MTNEKTELTEKDYKLINPILSPVVHDADGAEVAWDDDDPMGLEDAEVEALVQREFEDAVHALTPVVAAAPVLGGKFVITDKRKYNNLLARWRKNNVARAKAKKAGNLTLYRKLTLNNRAIAKQLASLRKPMYGANGVVGPVEGFNWRELACTDGTAVPTRYRGNSVVLCTALNSLRGVIKDHYTAEQVSIRVNSSYRTPRYNAAIGGVRNSMHLTAKAADIVVFVKVKNQSWKQVPIKALAAFAARVPKFNQGGIGTYVSANFVHVDTRPGAARWAG
jgi:hypothetical protein